MSSPAFLFHVHLDSLLIWGFAGTVVLTIVMQISQGLGLSRISLPFMVGTAFTAHRSHAQIIGFIFYFLGGWLFAWGYALIFENLGWTTAWLGISIGLLHGLFILVVIMPLLPNLHPRMANEYDGPEPTPMLEPPGFMAIHYGRRTPVITLIAHGIYGGILGTFYQVLGHCTTGESF